MNNTDTYCNVKYPQRPPLLVLVDFFRYGTPVSGL